MKTLLPILVALCCLLAVPNAWADDVSAGPNGINSRGLGVSGQGVNIGQVELGRPGEGLGLTPDQPGELFWDYGADQLPGTLDAGEGNGVRDFPEHFVDLDGNGAYTAGWLSAHPDVEPWTTNVAGGASPRTPTLASPPPAPGGSFITAAQYFSNFVTTADPQISAHALQVAGVMGSTGASNRGVATGAHLYSGAFGQRGATNANVFQTTEAVLRSVFDPSEGALSGVRSVNHSWGSGPLPAGGNDGSDPISKAIDYFSVRYDSLQVIAGDEAQAPPTHPGTPSDAFNVLNVSMLTDASGNGTGVYDRYDAGNRFVAAPGGRDTVHLAAPGRQVLMPTLGGSGYGTSNGTSFAAPHVTATTALLHEFGDAQRIADPGNWDASARRHQVMKAVLLNSADKLADDGSMVPVGKLLGMQKTIFRDAAGTQDWTTSPAYGNSSDPLDDQIGAGALNAARAFKQFSRAEHDSDVTSSGSIPLIGWDNAFSLGPGQEHTYYFDTTLVKDSFISITLSWDRDVTLGDTNSNGLFDAGEVFTAASLVDIDLFLYRKNEGTGMFTDLVSSSISSVDSTEHIFDQLDLSGEYAIQVRQVGAGASTEFGLAWWAVPEPSTALLVGLGLVGFSCRRRWRRVR